MSKNKKPYQPTPPAQAKLETSTLVFVRDLAHPIEAVWSALTDPAELREWAPFDPDRDLGKTGSATLTMAGGETEEKFPATVRLAEPPRLLEYDWAGDLLRWELEPTSSGTRLTLRHTVSDRVWAPKVAAGWHMCLDLAERFLDGRPLGRIVGKEAKEYGWDELNEHYARELGVENTGWPL